jgi:hypothetical protein
MLVAAVVANVGRGSSRECWSRRNALPAHTTLSKPYPHSVSPGTCTRPPTPTASDQPPATNRQRPLGHMENTGSNPLNAVPYLLGDKLFLGTAVSLSSEGDKVELRLFNRKASVWLDLDVAYADRERWVSTLGPTYLGQRVLLQWTPEVPQRYPGECCFQQRRKSLAAPSCRAHRLHHRPPVPRSISSDRLCTVIVDTDATQVSSGSSTLTSTPTRSRCTLTTETRKTTPWRR